MVWFPLINDPIGTGKDQRSRFGGLGAWLVFISCHDGEVGVCGIFLPLLARRG